MLGVGLRGQVPLGSIVGTKPKTKQQQCKVQTPEVQETWLTWASAGSQPTLGVSPARLCDFILPEASTDPISA